MKNNLYVKAQASAEKTFSETIRKGLSLELFSININTEGKGFIKMDGFSIKQIQLDRYNNFYCEIPRPIPIKYLPKFAEVIYELFENKHTFQGRSWIGFYIEYFKTHHDSLSLDDIRVMFTHPEFYDDGFKEWLVGTSYSSSGNIPVGYKYTKKQLKELYTPKEVQQKMASIGL